MNSDKDWIRSTLAHQETGKVPYNFPFTPPVTRRVKRYYATADLEAALGLPIRMLSPKSVKPLYASPAEFGETVADEFGVVWSTNELDRGSPVGPCLHQPSLADYTFPDPTAAYRFEDLGDWCTKNREHFTVIWVGDLWERATFMRGMADLLTDVLLNPAFVEELLDRIADYILQTMTILFDRFDFDCVALSDDYGAQKSLLMAPAKWRRLVKPRLAEIYASAKHHGRVIFHHSCGNTYPIIGDMIDIGLDILHPIQPEAMDILRLKREFGRHLTFCGGVRTQDVLPRGSVEDVRREVRRLKREMGQGGGYILEPGITIQADVPLENVIALIEEARNVDG